MNTVNPTISQNGPSMLGPYKRLRPPSHGLGRLFSELRRLTWGRF